MVLLAGTPYSCAATATSSMVGASTRPRFAAWAEFCPTHLTLTREKRRGLTIRPLQSSVAIFPYASYAPARPSPWARPASSARRSLGDHGTQGALRLTMAMDTGGTRVDTLSSRRDRSSLL